MMEIAETIAALLINTIELAIKLGKDPDQQQYISKKIKIISTIFIRI